VHAAINSADAPGRKYFTPSFGYFLSSISSALAKDDTMYPDRIRAAAQFEQQHAQIAPKH